jgi:hypothetical protein
MRLNRDKLLNLWELEDMPVRCRYATGRSVSGEPRGSYRPVWRRRAGGFFSNQPAAYWEYSDL